MKLVIKILVLILIFTFSINNISINISTLIFIKLIVILKKEIFAERELEDKATYQLTESKPLFTALMLA